MQFCRLSHFCRIAIDQGIVVHIRVHAMKIMLLLSAYMFSMIQLSIKMFQLFFETIQNVLKKKTFEFFLQFKAPLAVS